MGRIFQIVASPRASCCGSTLMPTPSLPQSHVVNRRFFLRAAGVTMALPLLESLTTRVMGANGAIASKAGAAIGASRPTRMVAIGNMLGFYTPEYFPKTTGRDYQLPQTLQPLAPHRNDFTILFGL